MRNLASTRKWSTKYRQILWIRMFFSSSLFNLYRFCRFQLLLDNAHFFVLPKVDFVFSGPHLLGFKVCELKILLIDNMLTTVLCLDSTNTARTARHYVSDSAAWSYLCHEVTLNLRWVEEAQVQKMALIIQAQYWSRFGLALVTSLVPSSIAVFRWCV